MEKQNKTAIVTGAGSGFGHEFSRLLAKDGYNLILLDINRVALQKVKAEIGTIYKTEIDLLACDLSKPESIKQFSEFIEDKKIDVLINNAGYGYYGFFYQTQWLVEENMIYLHILNLSRITKIVIQKMEKGGSGQIMNVSSIAAFQPGPLMSVYYASKAYILNFSLALSNEMKGTGVSITTFCPGQTRTNFQQHVAIQSNAKVSKSERFMADLEKAARYGYNAMLKGKPLAIPGITNKLIAILNRFLPYSITLALVRKLQENVRK
ncbi:MAG: SDR family oxidoreductase [Bacteroidales bacterium]